MFTITKFLANFRLVGLQPGSENNGTNSHIIFFIFIIEIDGISITDLFAFATDAFSEIEAVITVYCPGIGYSLREKSIYCSSFSKTLIKDINNSRWTFFLTSTAGCTFIGIYISCLLL